MLLFMPDRYNIRLTREGGYPVDEGTIYDGIKIAILKMLLPQNVFKNLTGCIARQLISKSNGFGNLIFGQAAFEMINDLIGSNAPALFYDNHGATDFTPFLVPNTDNRSLSDLRQFVNEILDLGRVDVFPARDDHVLDPAVDDHHLGRVGNDDHDQHVDDQHLTAAARR